MILLLALAFALELVAFWYFAAAGMLLPVGASLRWLISGALLVALVSFWGVYMAPRAARKLSALPYYAAKACIYAVSAAVIARHGAAWCAAFVVAALVDELLLSKHNLS